MEQEFKVGNKFPTSCPKKSKEKSVKNERNFVMDIHARDISSYFPLNLEYFLKRFKQKTLVLIANALRLLFDIVHYFLLPLADEKMKTQRDDILKRFNLFTNYNLTFWCKLSYSIIVWLEYY